MAVEIVNPGTGDSRPAVAAGPVMRQKPPRAVSERGPVLLPIAEVLSCRAAGAVLLDCREPAEFTVGHVRGAVSIGLRGDFEQCAGAVLPPDRDVVLVGDAGIAAEATARLRHAGYDRIAGQLDDLAPLLTTGSELAEASSRLSIEQLAELARLEPALQLVDVRTPAETARGHAPRSAGSPAGHLD
jgi:hydroxyacylglutathione hydrolase